MKIWRICLIVFFIIISISAFNILVSAEDTIQDFETPGTPYSLSNSMGPRATIEKSGYTGNFLRLVHGYNPLEGNAIAFEATSSEKCRQVIADFDFRIVSLFNTGGDGFGFALLNTSEYGTAGEVPHFHSEPNLSKSLGVGFDIFKNADQGDPDGNHLSLHFNGVKLGTFPISSSRFLLKSGFTNHAHIVVDFNKGTITITFGSPGEDTFSPINDFPIPGLKSYASRVAFGALSGNATATHDFDNIRVQFLYPNSK